MHVRLPRKIIGSLPAYVTGVVLSGVVLVLSIWLRADPAAASDAPNWTCFFWFIFACAAESFWISLPGDRGMVSMGLAADMAVLFILPIQFALLIAGLSVALTDLLVHHRGPVRSLFNSSQTVLSLAAAAAAMHALGGSYALIGSNVFLHRPAAALVTLPVFCIFNTGLVSGAIALEARKSLWRSWRDSFGFFYHYQSCAILFLLGLGLVVAVDVVGYVCGLTALAFLFSLRDAYKYRLRRRREMSTPDSRKADRTAA